MSVVNTGIHNLKAVAKSRLASSDVAVSVHRVLEINRPRILLDSAAVNIEWITDGSGSVQSASLVLSLAVLDTEALESMRMFTVDGELVGRLDAGQLIDAASSGCGEVAKEVADEVACYLAFSAKLSPELGPQTSALLAALRAKDFIHAVNGHERFKTESLVKADKYKGVRTGWWITGGMKLATIRGDVALLDCSRWELLMKLEEGNWQLKVARKRGRLPQAYCHGDEKYWCLLLSKSSLQKGDCLLFTRGGRGL